MMGRLGGRGGDGVLLVVVARGGATVGSMGSHDPLEAMEITLEVPWSCWCNPLELLVRPLGAAHHVFDEMSERRKRLRLQVEEEGRARARRKRLRLQGK
ncbi:hypothetical protein DVH24_032973 [Malus domestica]|uniref:Uncharacterized protein n=1 Tax=Malus domestica TaxID=3750 RepID=A0A498ING2_MALDO|nr:hypothetical protein DVH24_032973 [Malus domestica]